MIPTLVISLALLGLVSSIIISMLKDKKLGKNSCGCGCLNCGNTQCHTSNWKQEYEQHEKSCKGLGL